MAAAVDTTRTSGVACTLCGAIIHGQGVPCDGFPGAEIRCDRCGVRFVHPMPTQEELSQMYGDGGILEEAGTEEIGLDGRVIVPAWKALETEKILDLMMKGIPSGRVLDIGCLWGIFLTAAKKRGYDVFGLEPWEKAAQYCREVLGCPTTTGTMQDLPLGVAPFDGVAMLDVIEHCADPVAELKRVAELLRPGGILVLSTPNSEALFEKTRSLYRYLRRRPYTAVEPPFHVYAFQSSSMQKALETTGLAIEATSWLAKPVGVGNLRARLTAKQRVFGALSPLGEALGRGDRLLVMARKARPG